MFSGPSCSDNESVGINTTRIQVFLLTVFILLILGVDSCNGQWIMRAGDRREIALSRLIEEIEGRPLIFLGEEHDSMADHWYQIRVIKGLKDRGGRLAIGLEMYTSERQNDLDSWMSGKLNEQEFARLFQAEWKVPWAYYRAIFIYAKEHSIPLVGLNVPKQVTKKVAKEGFASLSAEERRKIPGEITCTVDAGYMELIRRAFAEHRLSDETFVRFCEAQLLWNRSMAWHALDYIDRHPGVTMVVLTGKAHAMKPGIPDEAGRMRKIDLRVILPEDRIFSRGNISEADADYLILKP